MAITTVLAVITVSNMNASLAWYERLFGRPADDRPMPVAAEWRLTDSGSVQLGEAAEGAGSSRLTLGVDDIDALAADAGKRGIRMSPVDAESGMFRFASITDPDGNEINLAQDIR